MKGVQGPSMQVPTGESQHTLRGWPTDMMDSSRTTVILADGLPEGMMVPARSIRHTLMSRGAYAATT